MNSTASTPADAMPGERLRPRPWWQIVLLFAALAALCFCLKGKEVIPAAIGPQSREITRTYIGRIAILLLLGATLAARFLPGVFGRSAQGLEAAPASGRGGAKALGIGLGILAVAIAFLEFRQPYYFSNDDTLGSTLPELISQFRILMRGEFSQWNPYNLLGEPTAGLGLITYPPCLISYVIARFGLGNEFAMFEVFAVMHLAAAYIATFFAARRIGIAPGLACAGGICCTLSGYALIAGRSWGPVVFAPMVFAPLIALSLAQLHGGKVGARWAIWTGLTIGIGYHAGFPQVWLYGMFCFVAGAALILFTRPPCRRAALWLVPALGIGAGVALPLVMTQWNLAHDLQRQATFTPGIEEGLANMLLPYPLASAQVAGFGDRYRQSIGQLYYSGSVFTLAAILGIGSLLAFRWTRKTIEHNIWIWIAALAFLIALGMPGGIGWVLLHLPVVGMMSNYPFRILPFFNLFAFLAGAVILQRALEKRTIGIAAAAAVALTLYGAYWCRPAFSILSFRPFPALDQKLSEVMRPSAGAAPWRVLPLGPSYSAHDSFATSLPLGVSSVYEIYSPLGYNPTVASSKLYRDVYTELLKASNDPRAFTRELEVYGVGVIALYDNQREYPPDEIADYFNNPWVPRFIQATVGDANTPGPKRYAFTASDVAIFTLPHPNPMAFAAGDAAHALPVQMHGWGMSVDTRSLAKDSIVVINVLAWPQWTVLCDGVETATQADDYHRLQAAVPKGVSRVEVRFDPGWFGGLCAGGGVLAAAMVSLLIVGRVARGSV